jgi:hypothetical protein
MPIIGDVEPAHREGVATQRTTVVARLPPAVTPTLRSTIELRVDTRKLYLFDPESGSAL